MDIRIPTVTKILQISQFEYSHKLNESFQTNNTWIKFCQPPLGNRTVAPDLNYGFIHKIHQWYRRKEMDPPSRINYVKRQITKFYLFIYNNVIFTNASICVLTSVWPSTSSPTTRPDVAKQLSLITCFSHGGKDRARPRETPRMAQWGSATRVEKWPCQIAKMEPESTTHLQTIPSSNLISKWFQRCERGIPIQGARAHLKGHENNLKHWTGIEITTFNEVQALWRDVSSLARTPKWHWTLPVQPDLHWPFLEVLSVVHHTSCGNWSTLWYQVQVQKD